LARRARRAIGRGRADALRPGTRSELAECTGGAIGRHAARPAHLDAGAGRDEDRAVRRPGVAAAEGIALRHGANRPYSIARDVVELDHEIVGVAVVVQVGAAGRASERADAA